MLDTSKTQGMILSGALVILALVMASGPVWAADGWITGTVYQSAGTIPGIPIPGDPIAGATVTVTGAANSVRTDAGGNYNITVPAGNCTLQASATGFNTKTSGAIVVTEGETESGHDFILEKPSGNLTGTVTDIDDGVPISMAILTYISNGLPKDVELTDASGRYLFEGLPVGPASFNITALGFKTIDFTFSIKAGQTGTKDFRLEAFTYFVMTVKDSGGKPLPGATVNVGNWTNTSDSLGMAILDVRPGSYNVEVSAEGYTAAKMQVTIQKGQLIAQYEAKLPKASTGGGAIGGGNSMLLVGGAVAAVVVVLGIVGFMFMRKRKSKAGAAGGPAGAAGGAAAAPGQAPWENEPAPGQPKTEQQKRKEWAEFERMYGRPHPEAPGWVGGGQAAAYNAPKPMCPVDDVVVSFEPYSGMYFCSHCHERYPAEKVFGPHAEPSQTVQAPRPASQPPAETQYAPSGPQQQPTWATQTAAEAETAAGAVQAPMQRPMPPPAGVTAPMPPPPQSYPPLPPPPVAPAPMPPPPQSYPMPPPPAYAPPQAPPAPAAAPVEARPVADEGRTPEARPVEGDAVPPDAGPVFNLPPPVSYEDGTVPPPPHRPPQNPPEQ